MYRQTKKLSLISFFVITASMVMTVYEYPTFATSKMNLVFYLLVGGGLWFIPVALCSAEMATVEGWEKGGLYTWVSNTLGRKWGFAAIFFQWFQITVGFVTMIYFILGALSYALDWPDLNTNVWLKLIGTLVIFWLITISQFGGTKNTAKIAKVGFFIGILGTGVLLFVLSIIYIAQGNPLKVSFGADAWIPNFTEVNTLVVFVSFILAYAGIESSASHVKDIENPGKNYPKAILMLVILTILLDTLGGVTVAATIPQDHLSLNTGVIQAYSFLIHYFGGREWLVRVIAVIICLGVIAEIATWVVGPSTAMLEAAKNGLLPRKMKKVNKHNVPINIVLIQGVVVSIWATVLTLGGGGANLSFFVAMALTVCIYLVAYVLLFLSYIKLVRKKDNLTRSYQIPGGKRVKICVAITGLLVSVFAFFISFFPPNDVGYGKGGTYLSILVISWLIILFIPFLIYKIFNKHKTN
ncbi:amino acid permease [Enterococcus faecalis]|nr:amino acid permease [Enterococcus faecalis]EGO5066820.1 amino acid permease [Enterococcus faecalis]EGO5077215.1 amino acid permease [Enterococcus faecalis]EHV2892846.1 amino acid permease [Enterococcus faecalis]